MLIYKIQLVACSKNTAKAGIMNMWIDEGWTVIDSKIVKFRLCGSNSKTVS